MAANRTSPLQEASIQAIWLEDGLIDEGMSMLEAVGDLDQAELVAGAAKRDRV